MRIVAGTLALAGLLIAGPAFAVDRLVDPQSTPCTSGPLPIHATISEAVAAAAAGETILVCSGTYHEHVVVNGENLTLRAQGVVKLVNPGGAGSGFALVTARGVTIQGFDISGYTGGCGVRAGGQATGTFHIRDNHIHGNFDGICAGPAEVFSGSLKIKNNVIEANQQAGVSLVHAFDEEVSANTVRNNGGPGIHLSDCHGSTVDHNLVTRNGTGIYVVDCHPQINNNTLRLNASKGIVLTGDGGGVVTHNLVQSSAVGISLVGASRYELSFNSISFNEVGIDIFLSNGSGPITRNNVSRSQIIDCRWDGIGPHTFIDNSCGTETPPGAWD